MRHTLERIRAEFVEMPGMRLTVSEVQRLCGVGQTMCRGILNELVEAKFLRANADGTYTRLFDGADVARANRGSLH
jgi:hypothetical protein